jgi:hypothetical protein
MDGVGCAAVEAEGFGEKGSATSFEKKVAKKLRS